MKNNLIDLLYEGEDKCNYADCGQCEYLGRESCGFHLIADHLIANGVTILTETKCNTINVKLPKEIMVHPYGSKWIPVGERLPENFVSVLGYMTDAGEFPPVRECYTVGNAFYFPALCDRHPVSHWMPLPEPPKEDK